jgi:hypothetical protein
MGAACVTMMKFQISAANEALSNLVEGIAMKQIKHAFALAVALAMTFPLASLSAESSDPVIGMWQLNVQKSKFVPGPPPQSQTRTYVSDKDRITMTAEGVDAKGNPTRQEWSAKYDGKDYPVAGSPAFNSIALKRGDDDFVVTSTSSKDGKIVSNSTRVVSKDRKELRITVKGTDDKGQPFTNVLVFDRR